MSNAIIFDLSIIGEMHNADYTVLWKVKRWLDNQGDGRPLAGMVGVLPVWENVEPTAVRRVLEVAAFKAGFDAVLLMPEPVEWEKLIRDAMQRLGVENPVNVQLIGGDRFAKVLPEWDIEPLQFI